MSRRLYADLPVALRDERDTLFFASERDGFDCAVAALAEFLATADKKFDRERFLKACGVSS